MSTTPQPSSYRVRPDGYIELSKHKLDVRSTSHSDLVSRYAASQMMPSAHSLHRHGSSLPAISQRRGNLSPANDQEVSADPWQIAKEAALLKQDPELSAVAAGKRTGASMPPRLKLSQHMLTQRESIALLEASMDQRLDHVRRESTEEAVSRYDSTIGAHAVIADVAHELTRQVATQCEERGRLLARVWLQYTDVVNSLINAWESEQQRHASVEARSAKQLQQARADYATVVSHAESAMRQSHERLSASMKEHSEREHTLTDQLEEAKAQLRRLQALVRRAARSGDASGLVADGNLSGTGGQFELSTLLAQSAVGNSSNVRVRELEAQLVAAQADNRQYQRQVQRLELQMVDSRAELLRLQGFLRGSDQDPMAPVMVDAAVMTTMEDLFSDDGTDAASMTPMPRGLSPIPETPLLTAQTPMHTAHSRPVTENGRSPWPPPSLADIHVAVTPPPP
jgi:hypothetical protein